MRLDAPRTLAALATTLLLVASGCAGSEPDAGEPSPDASPTGSAMPAEPSGAGEGEGDQRPGPDGSGDDRQITRALARKALAVGGIPPAELGVRLVSANLDDGSPNPNVGVGRSTFGNLCPTRADSRELRGDARRLHRVQTFWRDADQPETPVNISEERVVYRRGGAAAALDELDRAATLCPDNLSLGPPPEQLDAPRGSRYVQVVHPADSLWAIGLAVPVSDSMVSIVWTNTSDQSSMGQMPTYLARAGGLVVEANRVSAGVLGED